MAQPLLGRDTFTVILFCKFIFYTLDSFGCPFECIMTTVNFQLGVNIKYPSWKKLIRIVLIERQHPRCIIFRTVKLQHDWVWGKECRQMHNIFNTEQSKKENATNESHQNWENAMQFSLS